MIKLENVVVERNGRNILEIPLLEFHATGRYALIGENGSGKTTLLRLLARVIEPTRGQISGLEHIKSVYLPQKPYIFRLSLAENLKMLSPKGISEAEISEVIKLVGMDGFENQRADKLSGGEAQRLAIARLFLQKPELLLLDEPTAPIDQRGSEIIDSAICKFLEKNDATLIFATHSMLQAKRLAGTIIKLDQGKLAG